MTREALRRTARAAGVLVVGLSAVLLSTGVAEATVRLYHGSDWAEATSSCMRAYDGERDGNGVYADAYLYNGAHVSQWDGNGADGTVGPWACYNSSIQRFRVCEDHVGCSGWRYYPS